MIELDFDSVVEPKPLPKGIYPVQITAGEVKETGPNSKNPGRPQMVFTVGFIGPSKEEQVAPTVRHYVSIPHPDDEPKSFDFKLLLLKRFLTAFGLPMERNFDPEAVAFAAIGATADLEVDLTEPDDNGNVYNRLVLPRIRD
jgi:hypothetical protein